MNKKAFTLIELLVVVLIIGILAAIALPQYEVAVQKSKATTLFPMMSSLLKAQEAYYLANDAFASNIEDLGLDIPGATATPKGSKRTVYSLPNGINFMITSDTKQIHGGTELFQFNVDLTGENKGTFRCFAKADSRVAEQVCKSFGGAYISDTTCAMMTPGGGEVACKKMGFIKF